MCTNPQKIKNPNLGSKIPFILKTQDTVSKYILVPCGVCDECLHSRQQGLIQRCQVMLLDHYLYFCTLTYNNETLPSLTTSTGFTIKYADISDVQNMIKRLRKSDRIGRPFKYFFVSERGSLHGRPHFHGLFFIPKYSNDDKFYPNQLETSLRGIILSEWRRNVAFRYTKTGKLIPDSIHPQYVNLCTFRRKFSHGQFIQNYELHHVLESTSKEGSSDVAFYVTKYLLKPSSRERRLQQALRLNLSSSEYKDVWKMVKSRWVCSKEFGKATDLQKDYISSCLEYSRNNSDGLMFYDFHGNPRPLTKFFRKDVPSEILLDSVFAQGGPLRFYDRTPSDIANSVERLKVIRSKIDNRDFSELLNN